MPNKNYILFAFLLISGATIGQKLDPGFLAQFEELGIVTTFEKQPDEDLIVGGLFEMVNGQYRSNLIRLHDDGTFDTSFDTGNGANDRIYAISLQADGKILVGGNFTSFNDEPFNSNSPCRF